ncbi:RNA polymerase sigma factor [Aquibacillus sediminis]|uniref:RNA polymerase sigma factor n=1 Tax=Aquibacillus sediminis TaxID=2574734 RepID=UPI00148688CF|nr:RNA polymerase sigma factor [Aquibacillus sediminis]
MSEKESEGGRETIKDDQLIKKIRAGNKQALRLLIEKYKQHVFKVTYSVVHDEKEAEDLAQETFIKMMDALPSYKSQGFKTWLSRIALNKAIDFKRKKQRQKEDLTFFDKEATFQSPGESAEEQFIHQEREENVRKAIDNMPETLQAPVRYFHLQGLSYKEIAEKLEVEETTVKMRLYRARKWMKANWKEEEF